MKKKILFIISSDLFIRNYITTGVISNLASNYNLSVIALNEVKLKQKFNGLINFNGYFKFNSKVKTAHFNFFKVLMWKYRKKSKSFKFRFLRELGFQSIYKVPIIRLLRGLLSIGYNNIIINRWNIYSIILGNDILFPLFSYFYKKQLVVEPSLKAMVADVAPDLIIFPSNAFDPICNDVVRICENLEIPSLMLIDNWDNLSSKTVLYYKPTYLGVWGEQSKEHALSIHGYSANNVFIIGTPRFEVYKKNVKLNSHFNFPYILFVGCAIPFDEISALEAIDQILEKHNDPLCPLKIVYRPHPWRQKRIKEDINKLSSFSNVVLDPQVEDVFNSKRGEGAEAGIGYQPELTYYPSLIKNASCIVGPLTTMLIESLIVGKPTFAIAFNDNIHFTSPGNAHKYFLHFENLEMLDNINICNNKEIFEYEIYKFLNQGFDVEKTHKYENKNLSYFVENSSTSYHTRLNNTIRAILKN